MIRLKTVKIKACRSFVADTTFVFPQNGLVLINGKSGSGKSTIFYAVCYALGILPTGMTGKDLQSFLTDEKLQVDLELEDTGETILVGRGKVSYIEYGGKRYEGASLLSLHLTTVFGITPEMLSAMVFRPQKVGGRFLGKDSAEKVEFLSTVLGLDKIEKALESSLERLKCLSKQIQDFELNISTQLKILTGLNLVDTSAILAENDLLNGQLTVLAGRIEDLKVKQVLDDDARLEATTAVKTRFDNLKVQAQTILVGLQNDDKVKKTQSETAIKQLNQTLSNVKIELAHLTNLEKERVELVRQHTQLEKSICPTCNNPWVSREQLKKLADSIQATDLKLDSKATLTEQHIRLNQDIFNSIWHPNPQISEVTTFLLGLDAQMRAELPVVATPYAQEASSLLAEIDRTKKKLDFNALSVAKDIELSALAVKLKSDIELLETDKLSKVAEFQKETDFNTVIGRQGFLGSIFDEVLVELEQSINGKLGVIENVSGVTIRFSTESTTTKGIVKKTITPLVTIMGSETKLNALSGGMLTTLELVSDLAVKDLIENRTNRRVGFYFADEIFDGQGPDSQEASLELLQSQAKNKAIFVIDHHTEFKTYFNQTINIVNENGFSKCLN